MNRYRTRRPPRRRVRARPADRSVLSYPAPEKERAEAGELELPEAVTVNQLALLTGTSAVEIIKQLMRQGVMATINQAVDYSTAAAAAKQFGFVSRPKTATPTRSAVKSALVEGGADASKLEVRPPVVTILGHVDHGKTTLLDAIRQSNITAQEVGGITQHIGAYQVSYKGQKITFLDTPGHEAFTAMRARGAKVTDIAVLVVAADDGVMPQTVEAIDHAKAAAVPIVVALNKMDKPGANPERVKQQLLEQDLVLEEWGGSTIAVPVSAKARQGIEDLLENILVVAEVAELKANPHRLGEGVVVEAKMDKSRGSVATVLVQNGTLRVGDNFIAGSSRGRVKAMFNDVGKRTKSAGPSTPVEILGLSELPQAGDTFISYPDEKTAREMAEERLRQQGQQPRGGVTLEAVFSKIQAGEVKELNLILKTDVQGSVEAVKSALEKLTTDQARVKIVHASSGSINEGDVLLAVASKAVVIGFSTRLEPGARRIAEAEGVDVRFYDIIYRLAEDVQKAMEGLLEPVYREVLEGRAEVKAVFSVGKGGKAAGVQVTQGQISRASQARLLRSGKVIHDGSIASLRRFKDDVREVVAGLECGLGLEGFNDYQPGDVLEAYRRERAGK